MLSDESAQSSEEGSGLHSPVFGAAYIPPHGDNFRYQYDQTDVQHATANFAPRYDYSLPLNVQQPPHLDALELPTSTVQHAAFSSPSFPLSPRSQPALSFPVSASANTRRPPLPMHGVRQLDYRFLASSDDSRRLPGEPPHDQHYLRPSGLPAASNIHNVSPPAPVPSAQPTEPSTSSVASSSKTPRKEVSSVVIACNQCRSRKIRCDSKRPTCNNCARRSNTCAYDAAPKRRGPDKHPGTRQRRPKKRATEEPLPAVSKRRRTVTDRLGDSRELPPANVKENMSAEGRSSSNSQRQTDRSLDVQAHGSGPPLLSAAENRSSANTDILLKLDVNTFHSATTSSQKYDLSSPRNNESDKKLQWDAILTSYDLKSITEAFAYLYNDGAHWFSFLNIDHFLQCLYDDKERIHIQPAFIFSGMALATLMKSSEKGLGAKGREDALQLFGSAQTALSKSYSAGWVDVKLAAAAFIMALFESSLHPLYSPDRLVAALHDLDDIIRTHMLTQRDATNPLVSKFPPGTVPTILETVSLGRATPKSCSCIPPEVHSDPNINQTFPLPWNSTWTADEIAAEECRRICWNSLALISNYNTLCVCFNKEPLNFWLADSGNYAIFFPGEVIDHVSPAFAESPHSMSPKESIWALYCRSMLLWNFCNRLIWGNIAVEDRAEYSTEAMNETMSLQDSLDAHHCNLNTVIIYRCREFIHNARFTITRALRSILGFDQSVSPRPFFNRRQAEDWVLWQRQIIDRADSDLVLHDVVDKPGSMWTRRPYYVTWYSNQLAM
ncbi:hypothetical protein AX17_004221 [Amanita inopinata Kibby_2008]|nr:hypothetical protein AX17_004221 [Amanita inopinata Kibby_2008]